MHLQKLKSSIPIILSTVAFRNHSLPEVLNLVSELGYSQVEIWERHLFDTPSTDWPQILESLTARGLSAPVVSPFLSFTRGAERLQQSQQAAAKAIEIAGLLGSTRFRVFTDVGTDGLSSAAATADDWHVAVAEISRLCRQNPQLLFLVETHPWTLADTVASTERLLNEVAEPNLKIIFQPIQIFLNDGLYDVLERLWPAIAHMHWHQMPQDGGFGYLHEPGQVDFTALASFLLSRRYDGTVTIEYCWRDTQIEKMRLDRNFLDQFFAS